MSLTPELRQRIQSLLAEHRVLLFMKGSPEAPRCGFSAKAAGILDSLLDGYGSFDVLDDPDIRDGIKAYGNWPTIPQLYVDGELVGGSDIIASMLDSGELHGLLGLAEPDRTPPEIHITPAAADAIRQAMGDAEGVGLHLEVSPRFEAQFQLKPVSGREIVTESQGIRVHLDLASAPRARGIEIDWVDDLRGSGLAIRNPNAPPGVESIDVDALRERIERGDITVIDVRPPQARQAQPFPLPHEVLDEDSHDRLAALPPETPLAFLCAHGVSSRQAAEHFRGHGFRALFSVDGGMEAWRARFG